METTVQHFIKKALDQKYLKAVPETGEVYLLRFNPPKKITCVSSRGYLVGTLHIGTERKQIKAHQVIWLTVNGLIPEGYVLDHINGVRTDNRISNLRLATPAQNSHNRRSYDGDENPSRKLNSSQVLEIRNLISEGHTRVSLADRFSVSPTLVSAIARNVAWAHLIKEKSNDVSISQ